MFIVKTHLSPNGKLLAISDPNIIGKKFEEGKLQLDLTKDFYKGEEKSAEELKELIKDAYILHLTGEKTIQFFLELNLVETDNVLVVSNIPHAEVYLVRE